MEPHEFHLQWQRQSESFLPNASEEEMLCSAQILKFISATINKSYNKYSHNHHNHINHNHISNISYSDITYTLTYLSEYVSNSFR
jgi:hypothetical protein